MVNFDKLLNMPIVPPTLTIKSTNFIDGWAQMIYKIYHYGAIMPTEYGNLSHDACVSVTFTKNAINQILNGDLHPLDPYYSPTKKKLLEYRKQFTPTFNWEAQGFEYTYFQRFTDYNDLDQLQLLAEGLRLTTRRNLAITWMPKTDFKTDHPPCMQYIWIRRLPKENTEQSVADLFKQLLELQSQETTRKNDPNYKSDIAGVLCELDKLMSKYLEVHTTFRSHDAFGGTGSNSYGILNMVQDMLDKYGSTLGSNLKIAKYVIFDDSSHIYQADWNAASKVTPMNLDKILSYVD